jgi:hypothetical protein
MILGFPSALPRAAALARSAYRGTGPLTLWRSTIRSLARAKARFLASALFLPRQVIFSAWLIAI